VDAKESLMDQYHRIKKDYADCLLMYRLGDFYELFFDDAVTAARELDIALTGRGAPGTDRTPMCGVPHHAVDGYIAVLVEKGYKVAICDQVEDPKQTKKLVKREVVRVVTPGTILDSGALDGGRNNYLACVYEGADKEGFALAYADVTTGEFAVTSISADNPGSLLDELARLAPRELLVNNAFLYTRRVADLLGIKPQVMPSYLFEYNGAYDALMSQLRVRSLAGFGLEGEQAQICACGALISYLGSNLKKALTHITKVVRHVPNSYMEIDHSTRRNLELTANTRERTKRHSLLWVLDKTCTAMGARLLRKWVQTPLRDKADIERRLDAVESFAADVFARSELRGILKGVHDFERLTAKIVMNTATPRELVNLRTSLAALPGIRAITAKCGDNLCREIHTSFDGMADIHALLAESFVDDPPPGPIDSGFVRPGVNAELDKYRAALTHGEDWLAQIEAKQRGETGIKNLKVKYNKVFGYYIEVTNSNLGEVPEYYTRKQTLANCERFTIPDLRQVEEAILSADEQITRIERAILGKILHALNEAMPRLQIASAVVASVDVLSCLGEAAELYGYRKPIIGTDGRLSIINGRHPVVERIGKEGFVPNDTVLDRGDNRVAIITGPNMAGKSTYMRQVALIVLMAQMGSFVPADSAYVSVADKLFSRVGASDDLATGQSTFMTEMTEVANIINNATDMSLIVLDEIGRGTSTFDGISIASAVIEYIAVRIRAKTLCATHYHELTELEDAVSSGGIKNYSVMVQEIGDDIVFLRKIVPGGSDRSYGIHVARLAGLPEDIVSRAKELLEDISGGITSTTGSFFVGGETDGTKDAVRYNARKRENSVGKKGTGYIFEEADEIFPYANSGAKYE